MQEEIINPQSSAILKKTSFIRSNYPKLGKNISKKTIQTNSVLEGTLKKSRSDSNIGKDVIEREYLNKFSKQQELDKEKDIKFAEYLGDRAMSEEELAFENQVNN